MMDTEVLVADCKMKPDGFWFRRYIAFVSGFHQDLELGIYALCKVATLDN